MAVFCATNSGCERGGVGFQNNKIAICFFYTVRFNFGICVRVVNLVREIRGEMEVREEKKGL